MIKNTLEPYQLQSLPPPLIIAQLLNDISQVFFILIVDHFTSILRSEDDMIPAHPHSG